MIVKEGDIERQSEAIETITIQDPNVPGGITISARQVRELICPLATPEEVKLFLMLCYSENLNPFKKEVYLIKYDQKSPASTVVGKDTFTKRARREPTYRGLEFGVIVRRGKEILELHGCFSPPGDVVLGGWARVHLSNLLPVYESVKMDEAQATRGDGSPTRFWKKMGNTMIAKVAVVRALRLAFPEALGGLYDASEMPQTAGIVTLADGKPIASIDPQSDSDVRVIAELEEGTVADVVDSSPTVETFPCPKHPDEDSFTMRPQGFYSHMTNDPEYIKEGKDVGFCNMDTTLNKLITGIGEALNMDKQAILAEKKRLSGGLLFSQMEPSAKFAVYDSFKALVDKPLEVDEDYEKEYEAYLDQQNAEVE